MLDMGEALKGLLIIKINAQLNQNVVPITKSGLFAGHSSMPSCIPTSG
jgi:hypothetical protein